MRHDHVAVRAGLFVEGRALDETERLRHVDLHVIDEVAVPDGLEQAVREAEREDVLRRLLAEEVVDAEDLVFAENLVQPRVQLHRARKVGAERLLHDDARALHEARLAERPYRRERRAGRHAQVMQQPALAGERGLRALDSAPAAPRVRVRSERSRGSRRTIARRRRWPSACRAP